MAEYIEFALEVANKVKPILKEAFFANTKKTLKEDNSVLTETDLEVNELVLQSVKKAFPDHDFLGEEGSDLSNSSEYVWVCDPIDGTRPFSNGAACFVFGLALVKDGEPIVGVIVDPVGDRIYSAELGKGAKLNGKSISVSDVDDLSTCSIDIDVWYNAPYDFLPILPVFQDEKISDSRMGCALYASALVAQGKIEAYMFPGVNPWDSAAARIIVSEAGGKVTDIHGKDQRYDKPITGYIASNGKIHDFLLEAVAKHAKKR